MSTTTAQKKITATTVEEAQRLLDIVVDELQRLAVEEGTHGILVTKTGPGQFTVELSEDVPYGVTEEAVADTTDSEPLHRGRPSAGKSSEGH
jgi:hypothetical protein